MMLNAKYGVQFTGYSGIVIVKKYGREVTFAMLDFVSGMVSLHADEGLVSAPKRSDLKLFLETLQNSRNELQEALLRPLDLSQKTPGVPKRIEPAEGFVRVYFGPNTVSIAPGTAIDRFIRQLTKRRIQIEPILEQAEEIGLGIKRRPYSDYIDEIRKTGICRVEHHGFGLMVDGRLIFYPRPQVALVKRNGANLFSVFPLVGNP